MKDETTTLGGAATNKGIWYQALWIVLQAAADWVGINAQTRSNCSNEFVRLVLEPKGGDVRIEYLNSRRIVQLKVKSRGTWSLKDVITEVLPDLYRAVDISDDNATYEFVTEGRQGRWREALTFFNGLGGRLVGKKVEDAYSELSTKRKVPFAHKRGDFWQADDVTEKGLFDQIVTVVRGPEPELGKPDEREPLNNVIQKVWHLLARLRFSGGHAPNSVRREVEQALMRVVPQRENVPQVCDAMVGWIIEHSSANNSAVMPAELFAAHSLDRVVPIGNLLVLRRVCRERLAWQLEGLEYDPAWDVRRSEAATSDEPSAAISAFFGGSGEGKSWSIYAAADADQTAVVTLLDSSGDIEADLKKAASNVWQEFLGHDIAKPLANIAQHLHDVLGAERGDPWITIYIDRIEKAETVNRLFSQPLEGWGVRVVLGCEPEVAAQLKMLAKTNAARVSVRRIGAFTTNELHRYLRHRIGEGFARVPANIRNVLRNPQLAAIYCELVTAKAPQDAKANIEAWQPENEYDLVREFWGRLDGPQVRPGSLDAHQLTTLAARLLDDAPYPWTIGRLAEVGLNEEAIERLIRLGWVRRTVGGNGFEVPHDRLLGHAVARSLVARIADQDLSANDVADLLSRSERGPHARRLGYLLMDWFDLAARDDQLRPLADEVLRVYANTVDHRDRERLYQRLLPTLGSAAVTLLLNRLQGLAETANMYELIPIVRGLADVLPRGGKVTARDTVLSLLGNDRPIIRRTGLRLMQLQPTPDALDVAWRMHREMQADPTAYGGESSSANFLYRESFDALRATTRVCPEWLDRAIQVADPATEPVTDLAYLVANLNDNGRLWYERKNDLLAKVPTEKSRSLATNIGHWRDEDEVSRLEEWVRKDRADDPDLVAPAAMRAMARIDARRAVDLLPQMTQQTLYLCRGWFLPRLLLAEGDATRNALFTIISGGTHPLGRARVYQGCANDIDERTLEFLLNALDDKLAALLATQEGEEHTHLFSGLQVLAEIGRTDLLGVFARRKGTALEDNLARFLIDRIGPQRGLGRSNLEREPMLSVLLRVNGEAFCCVLREYLADDDPYAKLDVANWAEWHADNALISEIANAAIIPGSAEIDPWLLRYDAARLLAAHGDFAGLLKIIQELGEIPHDLSESLPDPLPIHRQLPVEAVADLRPDNENTLKGLLLMLGLTRADGAVEEALKHLQATGDKETRAAAITAIGLAGRQDHLAVSEVSKYLQVDELRSVAVDALLRIRGNQADSELAASLSHTWDDRLALILASRTIYKSQIVSECALRITENVAQKSRSPFGYDTLSVVLAEAPDILLGEILRACDVRVHDYLRERALALEGAFWVVGSKHDVIRGLSVVDQHAAYIAASITLESRDSHDRALYPKILYQLNPQAARDLFLKLASDESDGAVLASMAYALSPEVDGDWLCECLQDMQYKVRVAACCLATGPCGDGPKAEAMLRATTDDPSAEVSDAAVGALRHVHRQRQAKLLIKAIPIDAPQARVAATVQCAISVGDAGFDGGEWPKWTKLLFDSALVRRYPSVRRAAERDMLNARKKSAGEAKRQS